jgi:hypothetical protein
MFIKLCKSVCTLGVGNHNFGVFMYLGRTNDPKFCDPKLIKRCDFSVHILILSFKVKLSYYRPIGLQ